MHFETGGKIEESASGIQFVLHPVAFATDEYGFCIVQETIQDGGSESAAVVEDLRPVFKRSVSGNDNATLLVAVTDDLEEEIGAVLVDAQV